MIDASSLAPRFLERLKSPLEFAKSACSDAAARRFAAFRIPARPQPE
jgi:hypothetical protein